MSELKDVCPTCEYEDNSEYVEQLQENIVILTETLERGYNFVWSGWCKNVRERHEDNLAEFVDEFTISQHTDLREKVEFLRDAQLLINKVKDDG